MGRLGIVVGRRRVRASKDGLGFRIGSVGGAVVGRGSVQFHHRHGVGGNGQHPVFQNTGSESKGVVGLKTCQLGRATSIQGHGHDLVLVGHVVNEEVGLGKSSAVVSLTEGQGREAKFPEFGDVLKEGCFMATPLRFVSIHVAVVRVGAAVFTVFVAVVKKRRSGGGQQPSVGLQCGVIGGCVPRLTGQTLLHPLVVSIAGAGVGAAGQTRYVVAANVGHHERAGEVLVLTSICPEVKVVVVLVARHKHVVNHGVVQDKIGLTVQSVRTHVGVDGAVLVLIGFEGMPGPTHRGFALEVDVVADRFEPLVDLCDEVGNGQIFDVLDGVNASTVEIKRFHPPQRIGDELFRCVAVFPIHVRHVGGELTVEPMFGPVAVGLPANAPGVEPFGMTLDVFMVFMNVIYDEIHHHANAAFVSCIDHGVKFIFRTQTWLDAACLRRPVAVEGRDVMDAVGRLSSSVGSGVERRQPERVHTQVVEVARFDHLGHARKVTTLPVRTRSRSRG